MTRCVQALVLLALAAMAQTQPRLVFSHMIATDWQPDAHRWMNFVAISSDGRALAADNVVPVSRGQGFVIGMVRGYDLWECFHHPPIGGLLSNGKHEKGGTIRVFRVSE